MGWCLLQPGMYGGGKGPSFQFRSVPTYSDRRSRRLSCGRTVVQDLVAPCRLLPTSILARGELRAWWAGDEALCRSLTPGCRSLQVSDRLDVDIGSEALKHMAQERVIRAADTTQTCVIAEPALARCLSNVDAPMQHTVSGPATDRSAVRRVTLPMQVWRGYAEPIFARPEARRERYSSPRRHAVQPDPSGRCVKHRRHRDSQRDDRQIGRAPRA